MEASTQDAAREILEVVPLIMRTIRTEMRSHRAADLTRPLFRSLTFLERHPGTSLQDLAGHLGLTSPSAFKIVDGLVSQSLVRREPSTQDRRKIALQLTPAGKAVLNEARIGTQTRLAELLTQLSGEQCETVLQALKYLQPLFPPAEEKEQGEKQP